MYGLSVLMLFKNKLRGRIQGERRVSLALPPPPPLAGLDCGAGRRAKARTYRERSAILTSPASSARSTLALSSPFALAYSSTALSANARL